MGSSRPGGLAGRIEALQGERGAARGRCVGWLLGVPVGVALLAADVVDGQATVVVVACALVAAWWWCREARRVGSDVDDTIDELILHGWDKVAPEAAAARQATLLGARHRKRLARLLATGVYIPLPPARAGLAEQEEQVLLHRRRLEHVVGLLEDVGRPVDVRGVILVRRLVTAAHGSEGPTQLREELGSALQRIERFI
jgi:hypothetical protein